MSGLRRGQGLKRSLFGDSSVGLFLATISLSNASLVEGAANDVVIGVVSINLLGTWSFAVDAANDAGDGVAIVGTELRTTATPLDVGDYDVRIIATRAADGMVVTQDKTITVTASPAYAPLATPFLPADVGRIPVITTQAVTKKPAVVQQSFFDSVNAEALDPNMHPHLGTYTHVSVQDGRFSDPATWDVGTVPAAGDSFNIAAHHVIYDVESDDQLIYGHVGGPATLEFDNTKDTRLWIATLNIHGVFIQGQAGFYVPKSTTPGKPRSEIVFWPYEDPGATTKSGINLMGPVRVHGEPVAHELYATGTLGPGNGTTIPLSGLADANWGPGETIIFVDTAYRGTTGSDPTYDDVTSFYGYNQSPDGNPNAQQTQSAGFAVDNSEVRTIVSVNAGAGTIEIDSPLAQTYSSFTDATKDGASYTFLPFVMHMSRSVRWRAAETDARWKLPHAMGMHCDDQQVFGLEHYNMGRTDITPSLTPPNGQVLRATNGGTVISDPNNVPGRYGGYHFHRTGPYNGRKRPIARRCTAWSDPARTGRGWGFVSHGSNAHIEECNGFNFRGAIFVWELGSETGQALNNNAVRAKGDGFAFDWGSRGEYMRAHNGHQGVGFESQARQVLQQGNKAAGVRYGWQFIQQQIDEGLRIADGKSLRLIEPMVQGGTQSTTQSNGAYILDNSTYGIEQPQIPDFHRNTVFNAQVGLMAGHREYVERDDDTPMLAEEFHNINVRNPWRIPNYTWVYYVRNCIWKGPGAGVGSSAAHYGTKTRAHVLHNIKFSGFAVGVDDQGQGFNYGGFYSDLTFSSVTTQINNTVLDTQTGSTDPTAHPHYLTCGAPGTDPAAFSVGVIGGSSYTYRPTIHQNYDTAVALPINKERPPVGPTDPGTGTLPLYGWVPDPGNVYTCAAGTAGQLRIKGLTRDTAGVMQVPAEMTWSGSSLTIPDPDGGLNPMVNLNATGRQLSDRNGVWIATAGQVLSHPNEPSPRIAAGGEVCFTLHFPRGDRLDHTYYKISINCVVTGLSAPEIAAWTVDPADTNPLLYLPLLPEETNLTPYVEDTTPPNCVHPSTITLKEGAQLEFLLQCDQIHPTWSIVGGADAAHFELYTNASYQRVLRWTGGGTKDFEAPGDTGANNTYEVQVVATNPRGYASAASTVTATVANRTEGVVSPFTDNFNRANQTLETSPDWDRVDGQAGALKIVSNVLRTASAIVQDNVGAMHRCDADTGSNDHYVEFGFRNTFSWSRMCASVTDRANNIWVETVGSTTIRVGKRVAGVDTTLGNYTYTYSVGAIARLEYVGGAYTLIYNGSTLASGVAVASPPPATTKVGLHARQQTSEIDFGDNFGSGAI